jgi:hypothetical protein
LTTRLNELRALPDGAFVDSLMAVKLITWAWDILVLLENEERTKARTILLSHEKWLSNLPPSEEDEADERVMKSLQDANAALERVAPWCDVHRITTHFLQR